VNEEAQVIEIHITKSIFVDIKTTYRDLDRQSPYLYIPVANANG
jgi:hypothetical protein